MAKADRLRTTCLVDLRMRAAKVLIDRKLVESSAISDEDHVRFVKLHGSAGE